MTTPDAPREITVEEIDEAELAWENCFSDDALGVYKETYPRIFALARRALSQEGGLTADEMMGVGKYDPEPYPPSVSVERELDYSKFERAAKAASPPTPRRASRPYAASQFPTLIGFSLKLTVRLAAHFGKTPRQTSKSGSCTPPPTLRCLRGRKPPHATRNSLSAGATGAPLTTSPPGSRMMGTITAKIWVLKWLKQ
jgi:hypothetical protein